MIFIIPSVMMFQFRNDRKFSSWDDWVPVNIDDLKIYNLAN